MPSDAEITPEHKYPETTRGIRSDFASILGEQVSVDTVDTYATQALDQLIALIERIVIVHNRRQADRGATKRNAEDMAFAYFGLGNVESILDHIVQKATELDTIDSIISQVQSEKTVFIPSVAQQPEGLGGEFNEMAIVPRLKTLLFILQNEFDVDVVDLAEHDIRMGSVKPGMMRKTAYCSVDIPLLNKTVLVCDEEGNVTFVFDRLAVEQQHIAPCELVELPKEELKSLLVRWPSMGRMVVGKRYFVANLIDALNGKPAKSEHSDTIKTTGNYLIPRPPEGVMSITGLHNEWGIAVQTLEKAVLVLGEHIGPIRDYVFGQIKAPGYSYIQQEIILQHLDNTGLFTSEAPEGYLTVNGMRQAFEDRTGVRVSAGAIDRAIEQLAVDGTLGETQMYRIHIKLATAYSPAQQAATFEHLTRRGLFLPRAPDGYLAKSSLIGMFGVSDTALDTAIASSEGALGETPNFRFGSAIDVGFLAQQTEIIRLALESVGLTTERAPTGVLSASGIASNLHVGKAIVQNAIRSIADMEMGSVRKYRFGAARAFGYDQTQQRLIEYAVQLLKNT